MVIFEAGRQRKIIDKKYKVLFDRMKQESPEIRKELNDFFKEIEKAWVKISPFVGEEAAYGKSDWGIDDAQKINGMAFDFILWFVVLKRISDKLDKELKWFRENRETLEMIVKEYLEAQRFR